VRDPIVQRMLKDGVQTSEYHAFKHTSYWGTVSIVLGALTAILTEVTQMLGSDSKWGIIAGALLAIVGIITKTLVTLGYIKARENVKRSATFYRSEK